MNRLHSRSLIASCVALGFALAGFGQSAAMALTTYEDQSELGMQVHLPVHSWVNHEMPLKGIIVAQQGLIFTGRSYGALARHFNELGYAVYANDMRGFGGWRRVSNGPSKDFNGDNLVHYGQSKDDLTVMLSALRAKHKDVPIYCLGESFGANLAIWEASTNPEMLDGVIAASAGTMVHIHPRWIWFRTLVQGLMGPYTPINIEPYVSPILSEDKNLTHELLSSTEACKQMSVANLIKAAVTNRRSVREVEKIPEDMPILLLNGKKDQVEVTRFFNGVIKRMGSKQVTQIIFPHKGHMLLEGEKLDPIVKGRIDKWIKEQEERLADKKALPVVADQGTAS